MRTKLILIITLFVQSINLYGQNYSNLKILKIDSLKSYKVSYYKNKTLFGIRHWKTRGPRIKKDNYEELVRSGKIYAEGEDKKYYSDGTLMYSTNFVNDHQRGEVKQYYANGKLFSVVQCNDLEPHGQYYIYYPNGNVMIEGMKRFSKRVGSETHYYSNGIKKAELNFRSGYLDSVQTYYNVNGDKIREIDAFYNRFTYCKGDSCDQSVDAKELFKELNFNKEFITEHIEGLKLPIKVKEGFYSVKLVLLIDQMGKAARVNTLGNVNGRIKEYIQKWAEQLPNFKPVIDCGLPCESQLHLELLFYNNEHIKGLPIKLKKRHKVMEGYNGWMYEYDLSFNPYNKDLLLDEGIYNGVVMLTTLKPNWAAPKADLKRYMESNFTLLLDSIVLGVNLVDSTVYIDSIPEKLVGMDNIFRKVQRNKKKYLKNVERQKTLVKDSVLNLKLNLKLGGCGKYSFDDNIYANYEIIEGADDLPSGQYYHHKSTDRIISKWINSISYIDTIEVVFETGSEYHGRCANINYLNDIPQFMKDEFTRLLEGIPPLQMAYVNGECPTQQYKLRFSFELDKVFTRVIFIDFKEMKDGCEIVYDKVVQKGKSNFPYRDFSL